MTVISLMMMTSKITLSTTAIATRYWTRYSDFLLLLDSKSKTTTRWGLITTNARTFAILYMNTIQYKQFDEAYGRHFYSCDI